MRFRSCLHVKIVLTNELLKMDLGSLLSVVSVFFTGSCQQNFYLSAFLIFKIKNRTLPIFN